MTGDGAIDGPWRIHSIGSEPTVHRMRFADGDGDGRDELIVVPLLGRGTTRPHFQESGVRILSFAIPRDPARGPWKGEVINNELHVTHNFWPVDLNRDDDASEELIIGVRDDFDSGHRRGVRIYDPQDDQGRTWSRTLVDPGGVAVEDLGVDDLDSNGRADIVAVGRQTHNVKIYWNQGNR
jgi:hypothetical protein